jgi:hypothetical protein
MLAIDEDLRAFIESGAAVSVGTRDADLIPSAARGWGPRVSADGRTLDVFVDKPAAAPIEAGLRDNGRIAVCFVDVITLRALQLKGRCVEIAEPGPDDWQWVDRHREAFVEAVGALGFPPQMVRNLWSLAVIKVRFVVEEYFDQTPGPEAGRAI